MADTPEVKPTLDGRGGPTDPQAEVEAPLGTMQMPRGGETVATLEPTRMPTTAAPLPNVAPPAMPADFRYSIKSEIARGGMGRVVEATDTVLGRTVALKEVLSLDPETVRRFQRETKITARLEHPAIVPVHDAGVTPAGAPYYVMRKIGGRALEDLVARADTLDKRLALVPHIVTAAQAIAHAHERGIVHRDIKPSNILAGDLGETIVIDWGLAKAIGEAEDPHDPKARVLASSEDDGVKTQAGIVFGTPGFMAPEQLRGKPVDERCDVYALGATLYHLLARRPPHHNKNPDVMMRSAVDGPPVPLDELIQGVPRELVTIVDKAIAHDATRRYQNAGELADDLQRFLTGQLVRSHAYTARERLERFWKQNRAAVTIGSVAIVAGIAGTAFAFLRIRDERDRADEQARIAITQKKVAEQQKEQVVQKARELVLANAQHASSTDPTRAVAMVKPLVESELWRSARDVGAAARASGVAFSIPMSRHTLTLELSRDGQRALAAGDDGKVRLVDIDKRTTKEVANVGGEVMARFADGERKIVLYQGSRLTIIDTDTLAKREVTAPTSISKLEVAGPLVYWVDPADAVWRLDLAGGPPTKIELTEPVKLVMPSPDGRWIAFGGTQHLLLADRSNPSLPAEIVSEGVVKLMTWSADSGRLAVQIDDEVIDVKLQPTPQIWERYLVGTRFGLAYSGGQIFSSGPLGVGQLTRRDAKLRLPDPGHTLGVHEGRERVVISAKPQGEIVVLSDYGDHILRAPLPIEQVATSSRGQWIVAAAENMLLVWNLEHFEPRSFTSYPPSSARFVTADAMIVTYQDESAEWIDLRSGKATALGNVPALETIVAAPDGADAIAIDLTRRAWHIAGVGEPQALPGEVSAAAYIDNTHVALATDKGIRLDDQQAHASKLLLEHKAAVRRLTSTWTSGGWIAATFDDGTVWRSTLAGGAGKFTVSAPVPAQLPVALQPDGTALVGVGPELRAWRPDGRIDVILTLGAPIVDLVASGRDGVLVTLRDASLVTVDVRARRAGAPMTLARDPSIATDGSLIAGSTVIGGVEVIDPAVGWRWPLASPQKGFQQPFTYVEIARDGSRVLGVTQDAVVVWPLALPGTADETGTWLDRTTNATAENPTGPLGWSVAKP